MCGNGILIIQALDEIGEQSVLKLTVFLSVLPTLPLPIAFQFAKTLLLTLIVHTSSFNDLWILENQIHN